LYHRCIAGFINNYSVEGSIVYVNSRLTCIINIDTIQTGGINAYPWGDDDPDCNHAVIDDGPGNFGCGTFNTTDVCSRPLGNTPNGLCDMVGNLQEWTMDWYSPDYYSASDKTNPRGPKIGTEKVLKGGAWMIGMGTGLRVYSRWHAAPIAYNDIIMSINKGLFTSERLDWETPNDFFEKIQSKSVEALDFSEYDVVLCSSS